MKDKIISIYNFFADDTPYYAASLSFFTIFSILPLIALLIVVVSSLPSFAEHLDLIMLYILDFINPTHSDTLANFLNTFLVNTDKLGDIGVFYLLFVFTMFFRDYEFVINKIYDVPTRAIYKLFFLYLSFLLLIPMLLFLSVLLTTMTSFPFSSKIAMYLFIWVIFVVLFIVSANTKVSFQSAVVSSLVTLVVLFITKNLFGYYVSSNSTYATIYGSFSIALFFFLWIYVSWSIYLYGTKLCAILNKGNVQNEN
ncbi:MAG: YhjD/YihY/BrkB family envelope integrity protein [Campylobacterota bacterium]|nr:YhjD/YihY/BrkB family envelope integrity protein [Campylobacterota bacterium]